MVVYRQTVERSSPTEPIRTEYDLDQLFLGTLLFTVSAFLFPTVMVYAALLALVSGLVSSCGVSVM